MFKYSKYYSGKEPQFIEGDVFRIIVPLDDNYSFDYEIDKTELVDDTNKLVGEVKDSLEIDEVPISADKVSVSADKMPASADKVPINVDEAVIETLSDQQKIIYEFVLKNEKITSRQAEGLLHVKQRRARAVLSAMVDLDVLKKQGLYKSTVYILNR